MANYFLTTTDTQEAAISAARFQFNQANPLSPVPTNEDWVLMQSAAMVGQWSVAIQTALSPAQAAYDPDALLTVLTMVADAAVQPSASTAAAILQAVQADQAAA